MELAWKECGHGVANSERRRAENADAKFPGQRLDIRYVAFGDDSHRIFDTAGVNHEPHPQYGGRTVAPGVRNVSGKRDHCSGFRVEYLVAERAAGGAFQHKEIFILVLMDVQWSAIAGLRGNLDERINAIGVRRRHAYQAKLARPGLHPVGVRLVIRDGGWRYRLIHTMLSLRFLRCP